MGLQEKLYSDDQFNIETIAVVLRYFAKEKLDIEDMSEMNIERRKIIVGRYNAKDPKKQKKYSEKCLNIWNQ